MIVSNRRLKLWVGPGIAGDYQPRVGAGRWWLHWERWPFALDLWLSLGALWIEVFRFPFSFDTRSER